MLTIIIISLLLLGINMRFCDADEPATFEQAFADATQAAETMPRDRRLRSLLSRYEKLGSDLASRFPDADAELLEVAATNKENYKTSNLAWVVLAKLADRKEAHDIILQHAVEGEEIAILAVSFMPEPVRKESAETIATQGKEWETRKDMVELLGHIGDENTDKILDKIAKEEKGNLRQAAIDALSCRQEKLKQPVAEQETWTQCGVLFWRVAREVALPAYVGGERAWSAELLSNSGVKFPASFLRYYIKAGDPIALRLAGIQKESELVDDLDAVAQSDNVRACRVALGGLIQIGNKPAMDSLSKHMKPENTSENNVIANGLAQYGTREAVELLERLLKDERYKESWPVFEEAIKRINERLKAQPPNGEPSPPKNGESAPPTNGEPASSPTDDSALTAFDTAQPSATTTSAAAETQSPTERGAEAPVAEATPFPWAIVIVVAIAALAVGAITTLLLTRAKKTAK